MSEDKLNFSPSIWGNHAWSFLHAVALSFPVNASIQTKQDYKDFFLSIGKILPCHTCQNNFASHIVKPELNIDKYLGHPHDLFSWTVKMRNEVQKMLNKPEWDELALREKYYNANVAAAQPQLDYRIKIILAIAGIVAGYYLFKRYYKK